MATRAALNKAAYEHASSPRDIARPKGDTSSKLGYFILVFTMLCLPFSFEIGSTRFSAERLLVLLGFFPVLIVWIQGRAGRITPVDLFITLYSLWIIITYVLHEGLGRFPFAVMVALEAFTAFLLGKILVRNYQDYKTLFKVHIGCLLILLPFTFPELLTGAPTIQNISEMIFGSGYADVDHPPRMGLYRVQSFSVHPILFGLFCSIAVGNAYYLWRDTPFAASWRTGLAFYMTFTSLSSAAFLAAAFQVGLVLWGMVTKNRWKLLFSISVGLYIFLSIASNRGPIILLIETVTFSADTAWNRVYIWQYGIQNVIDNPIIGFGAGDDWVRPSWMLPSVDNFWLVLMMRHGFTVMLFFGTALILHILYITRVNISDKPSQDARTGYMVTVVATMFVLSTVHIWGSLHVFFMFYLGAGAWFYDGAVKKSSVENTRHTEPAQKAKTHNIAAENTTSRKTRSSKYSRF